MDNLKITFLGGIGEIGKNMTVFECGQDMIVVDSGLSFPDENMPGVDVVIQDYSYFSSSKFQFVELFSSMIISRFLSRFNTQTAGKGSFLLFRCYYSILSFEGNNHLLIVGSHCLISVFAFIRLSSEIIMFSCCDTFSFFCTKLSRRYYKIL